MTTHEEVIEIKSLFLTFDKVDDDRWEAAHPLWHDDGSPMLIVLKRVGREWVAEFEGAEICRCEGRLPNRAARRTAICVAEEIHFAINCAEAGEQAAAHSLWQHWTQKFEGGKSP